MVSPIQKLTREQIAAAVGNNPRAIKMFELLLFNIANTVPTATDAAQSTADKALALAGYALTLAGDGGGDDGGAGPPGTQGLAGPPGATGPQGLAGLGLDGDDGADGYPIPGPMGPQGSPGLAGAAGAIGPAVYLEAEPGSDGEQGLPGPAGAAGPAGPQGPAGVSLWLYDDPIEPDPPIPGPAGAPGLSGSGGGTTGTVALDFGAFPGSTDASVVVTGQAGITSGALPEAWVYPTATADHSADEHWVDPPEVVAGNVTAGTGFTVYGVNKKRADVGPSTDSTRVRNTDAPRLYGLWTVAWRY